MIVNCVRCKVIGLITLVACVRLFADAPTTQPLSAIANPTTVTMSLKNASVKAAFDELEKQSKIKINIAPNDLLAKNDAKINIEADKMPWLEALMSLCDQANIIPSNYGDRWNINQGGDRRMGGIRAISGPAMVILHNVAVEDELRYGTPNKLINKVQISGLICIEPNLQIINTGRVEDLTVTDDQSRVINAPTRDAAKAAASRNIDMGGERRDFTLSATLPDNTVKQLSRVQGNLIALSATERAKLEIPDLLNNAGKSFAVGKSTFTVDEINPTGNMYLVKLDIDNAQGDFENISVWQWRMNQKNLPKQTNSKVPATINFQNVQTSGDQITLTLLVQWNNPKALAEGEAYPTIDVQWEFPLRYQEVKIPFDFKDIPLPK